MSKAFLGRNYTSAKVDKAKYSNDINPGMKPLSSVVAAAFVKDYLQSEGTPTDGVSSDIPLSYLVKMYEKPLTSQNVWSLMRRRFSLFNNMCFSDLMTNNKYAMFAYHIQNGTVWDDPDKSALSVLTSLAVELEKETDLTLKTAGTITVVDEYWEIQKNQLLDSSSKNLLALVNKANPDAKVKAAAEIDRIYSKIEDGFKVEQNSVNEASWVNDLTKYWEIVEVTDRHLEVLSFITPG